MKVSKTKDRSGIHWFVRRGSKVRGPFPSGTIRRLVAAKRIELTDEVSLDKELWRQVALVDEVLPPNMRGKDDMEPVDEYSGIAPDLSLPFEDKKPFPYVPLLVSLMLIIGVVGIFILFDEGNKTELPDCNATPAAGINWNNCKLAGMSAEQSDLSGLQASNTDLSGAKLSGAVLGKAKMQYANLVGADLSYADLTDASLKGATLRSADLSYADLTNADLSYADLTQANLSKAKLDNAVWSSGKRCSKGSLGECRQPVSAP